MIDGDYLATPTSVTSMDLCCMISHTAARSVLCIVGILRMSTHCSRSTSFDSCGSLWHRPLNKSNQPEMHRHTCLETPQKHTAAGSHPSQLALHAYLRVFKLWVDVGDEAMPVGALLDEPMGRRRGGLSKREAGGVGGEESRFSSRRHIHRTWRRSAAAPANTKQKTIYPPPHRPTDMVRKRRGIG